MTAQRTLTVLTPVHAAGSGFLDETAASVASVSLPPGWRLEWVVQEDGDDPVLRERVEALGGLYGANRVRGGASVTRNMALLRARGEVTFSLDADDTLTPGGLAELLSVLDDETGWLAGGHVTPDGTPDQDWDPARATRWPVLALARHGSRDWGFHPNNLLVRTALLWRVGGWPALAGMEDKMLVMALNTVSAGASTAIPTVVYRRHSGQSIATESFLGRLDVHHAFVTKFAQAQHP
jgi:glycosyltransferase involved in cell wall biosynthesis